jgi:hypothetical protein
MTGATTSAAGCARQRLLTQLLGSLGALTILAWLFAGQDLGKMWEALEGTNLVYLAMCTRAPAVTAGFVASTAGIWALEITIVLSVGRAFGLLLGAVDGATLPVMKMRLPAIV